MTIGTAYRQDASELARLWQTCFGDTENYVNLFMQHVFQPENTFVLRDPGIAAMAFALPVQHLASDGAEAAGAYLYAVCTAPDRRGRGCFRTLMSYAEQALADRGLRFVCLKPGSDALAATYGRLGYAPTFRSREFRVKAEQGDVRLESIEPARYATLRDLALRGNFIDYPTELLAHQARLGQLFEIQDGRRHGFGAAERAGGSVILKEYLGDTSLLPAAAASIGVPEMTVRMPGGTHPFAMAKALDALPCPGGYLAFAFD